MKQRTVIWKPVEYQGMEYMRLREDVYGVLVQSVVIGAEAGNLFRLDYQIRCDLNYVVRDVRLMLGGDRMLHLISDGQGGWTDDAGQPLPQYEGCIDIDISATPFTNTLPIKRVAWQPGQSETFRMVWFAIPELTAHVDEQRYTCVEQSADGTVFRFEQVATGFTALLSIDADGLVKDYPGLFVQV